MQNPLPKVERTIRLGVSPSELWQHLVDGELASLWVGGKMTVEPRLNGKVTLKTDGAPEIFGTVEEIITGAATTWTWRTAEGEPTQVTLRLARADDGCQLTVTEEMLRYEIVSSLPPSHSGRIRRPFRPDSTRDAQAYRRLPHHGHRIGEALSHHPPGSQQHLAALDEAGLVERTSSGREVRYSLRSERLDDVMGWVAEVGGEWDQRLARLKKRLG